MVVSDAVLADAGGAGGEECGGHREEEEAGDKQRSVSDLVAYSYLCKVVGA